MLVQTSRLNERPSREREIVTAWTRRSPTTVRTATLRTFDRRSLMTPVYGRLRQACSTATTTRRRAMAGDFEIEPKLAWMRQFVRDEIIPLETLADRWRSPEGRAVFRQITDPLKDEVRRQ